VAENSLSDQGKGLLPTSLSGGENWWSRCFGTGEETRGVSSRKSGIGHCGGSAFTKESQFPQKICSSKKEKGREYSAGPGLGIEGVKNRARISGLNAHAPMRRDEKSGENRCSYQSLGPVVNGSEPGGNLETGGKKKQDFLTHAALKGTGIHEKDRTQSHSRK